MSSSKKNSRRKATSLFSDGKIPDIKKAISKRVNSLLSTSIMRSNIIESGLAAYQSSLHIIIVILYHHPVSSRIVIPYDRHYAHPQLYDTPIPTITGSNASNSTPASASSSGLLIDENGDLVQVSMIIHCRLKSF